MNKNKGFIGIGLIIAIVLGIAVVGGGAYYLGKSSDTKKEVKTEENNLPNNSEVNQNQPAVDNNQQTNITSTTTPPVLTDCTSSSTPSIKVLYPNGGEVYTVGQNVTFKWKTCNVPSSVHINAQIIGENSSSESLAFLCEGGASTWGPECLNDGEQRLETSRPGIFKINISTREGVEVSDMSDNSFTINSGTYTYKNHGITFTLPSGYIPHEEQAEGGPAILISLPNNNYLSYITDASFWEKWSIPQYKYIKDEKIGETTFKVYTSDGITIYYFKQGNIAYEYSGDKNFLNTFRFVGWN